MYDNVIPCDDNPEVLTFVYIERPLWDITLLSGCLKHWCLLSH
jgi:hypothetical protein